MEEKIRIGWRFNGEMTDKTSAVVICYGTKSVVQEVMKKIRAIEPTAEEKGRASPAYWDWE